MESMRAHMKENMIKMGRIIRHKTGRLFLTALISVILPAVFMMTVLQTTALAEDIEGQEDVITSSTDDLPADYSYVPAEAPPAQESASNAPAPAETETPASGDAETAQTGEPVETVLADEDVGSALSEIDDLIVEDGKVTVSREGKTLQEVLEEEAQVTIPGFSVDPSRYPAANITENTLKIYRYLRDTLGLGHAAACGVLANVQMESNFRPIALGDGGTSYGICQWHLGRFVNLINHCEGAGLDYNTIEGQLDYLRRELEGGYYGVYQSLLQADESPQGAYEAAYVFCYSFERPSQTAARSEQRGNLAKNEYYPRSFEEYDLEPGSVSPRLALGAPYAPLDSSSIAAPVLPGRYLSNAPVFTASKLMEMFSERYDLSMDRADEEAAAGPSSDDDEASDDEDIDDEISDGEIADDALPIKN